MRPGEPVAVHWRYSPIGRIPAGRTSIPKSPQVTRGRLVQLDRDGVTLQRAGNVGRVTIPWPLITKVRVIS